MLEAITSAQKSIYIEMYILENDEKGLAFFTELEKATRKGVQVILMLDVIGSYSFMNDAVDSLRKAGAEVIFVSSFFRRLHRKIFIIDEHLAFVGGVNIGKEFTKWRDLQISVTGGVVQHILGSFVAVYKENGGKADIRTSKVKSISPYESVSGSPKKQSIVNRARLWFLDHRAGGNGERGDIFGAYYSNRIKTATKSIVLVSPYLLPPRWFIAHLHQAMIRGVRVEILLPVSTDHRFINVLNHSYAACLSDLGATLYFSEGMNHAKAMLVDNVEGVIGSQNLDLLSFHVNLEAGVFFKDSEMVQQFSDILDNWKKQSVAYAPGQSIHVWYESVLGFVLRLLGFLPFEWNK